MKHILSVWDARFLALANHIGMWSKDPSKKVGAVIARPDKTIASIGFNGFPRRVVDDASRYDDRTSKLSMVVHAELNAIIHAHEPLHGYTIYVSPLHPCSACAGAIIQAGIARVVAVSLDDANWRENFDIAAMMFSEASVSVLTVPTI